MRTFVIGDVHGAYRALLQVLERSGFDFEKDKLISLGDIVDGWSESYECMELLTGKVKNLIAVKGNHDDCFLQYLETGKHPFEEGGKRMHGWEATYQSYFVKHSEVPNSHLKLLRQQMLWYLHTSDFGSRLFVHAAIDPHRTLQDVTCTQPYLFYWDRNFWLRSLGGPIETREEFSRIYIGHTSTSRWKEDGKPITTPMNAGNVWNIDTGAGGIGKLSMVNIDTQDLFQSDIVMNLYPGEKPRR